MLADGIQPDVAGNRMQGFGRAQNVLIAAHFPEALAAGLAEIVCRARFEIADEFAKINGRFCALGEDVKMVRHQTVRVEKKGIVCCSEEQRIENPARGFMVRQKRMVKIAADGHEIGALAEVVGTW